MANISVHNSMLRIHLDKDKVMKTFIPRIAKEGMKYGASKLLLQVGGEIKKTASGFHYDDYLFVYSNISF